MGLLGTLGATPVLDAQRLSRPPTPESCTVRLESGNAAVGKPSNNSHRAPESDVMHARPSPLPAPLSCGCRGYRDSRRVDGGSLPEQPRTIRQLIVIVNVIDVLLV